MKKSLIQSTILLLTTVLAFSSVHAQEDAGQPGEFLRYGVNARALGMGRAFTAVTDNANAVYWNPGGLYNIIRDGLSLTLMYSKLFESTSYNFAAFALPIEMLVSADNNTGFVSELKKWNLGFGYLGLSSDDFEVRNSFNQKSDEFFSDAQSAIYFSITRAITLKNHRFGLGVNYKLLTHEIFDQKANSSAIDVGIKYQPPITWLELGAVVQNVNSPDFKFAQGGADEIPFSARVGAAIKPKTGQRIIDSFLLSFDFVAVPPGERDPDWFAGAEYDLMNAIYNIPVKLRFGINSREDFTFGINLDLPNNIFFTQANQVLPKLDWAYLPNQNSMGTLAERFSLDFSYTPFTSERWYKRGLEKLDNEQFILAQEDLSRSIYAKNPRRLGYPVSATLRLGDLEVLSSKDKFEGLKSALKKYRQVEFISTTREEIDPERNHESYLNFIQGLFLERRYNDVIRYTSVDSIWNNHHTLKDQDKNVIAYRSWSYYFLDQEQNALETLRNGRGFCLCDFLLGLIRLKEKEYQEARGIFQNIVESGMTGIPDDLYVTPFRDNLIIDDSQFLFAYAGTKVDETVTDFTFENLLDFAQIQRIYPKSDLDVFLQSNNQFELLIEMINIRNEQVLDSLFDTYLKILDEKGFFSTSDLLANLR